MGEIGVFLVGIGVCLGSLWFGWCGPSFCGCGGYFVRCRVCCWVGASLGPFQ